MAEATPNLEQMWKDRPKGGPTELPSYSQWKQAPTPQNLRQVVTELDPTITSAVNTYAGNRVPDTVRQRAKILAAKAIKTYDPKFGASLQTHVNRQLQALQRMQAKLTDPFPMPEKHRLHSNAISTAMKNLEDFLGREPTDEEIADETKLPIQRVVNLRQRQRARVPMSAYEVDDDDDTPEQVASSREPQDDWMDAVYHDLGETDKLIFMHRTGYRSGEPLSNMAIAQKLGVSPAYVSQRARWIQKRLDEFNG